ncbi:hypothetical protein L596_015076 [Steinernema carpocapsae]|uniref:LITAF domain-containing protein n=1 Tax=Steinernema carpocapsae TaxID=34508 RepID=A0A4U5NF55_STECR|nr:hypothetical protein L596_015076 [Steinernema carpocapsae]
MLRMTDAPPPYSPVDPQTPNFFAEAPPLQEKHSTIIVAAFGDPAIFVAPSGGEGIKAATGVPQSQVETVVEVKKAPTKKPYDVYCPRCHTLVHTNRRYVTGTFTWVLFFVLLFVFFPLCWVPFFVNIGKDVEHLCPQCESLIAIRKAAGC